MVLMSCEIGERGALELRASADSIPHCLPTGWVEKVEGLGHAKPLKSWRRGESNPGPNLDPTSLLRA
jgi:hypothetical protein